MTHTETHTTERVREGGGGGVATAFIVFGVLALIAIVAWFIMSSGAIEPAGDSVNLNVEAPSIPEVRVPDVDVNMPSVPEIKVPD